MERAASGSYAAWVREAPVKGEANQALIGLLAAHFKVPKADITMVAGQRSRNKIFDIK